MNPPSKLSCIAVIASSLTLLTLRVLYSHSKSQKASEEEKRAIMFSSSKSSIDNLLVTPQELNKAMPHEGNPLLPPIPPPDP